MTISLVLHNNVIVLYFPDLDSYVWLGLRIDPDRLSVLLSDSFPLMERSAERSMSINAMLECHRSVNLVGLMLLYVSDFFLASCSFGLHESPIYLSWCSYHFVTLAMQSNDFCFLVYCIDVFVFLKELVCG